MTAGGSFGTGHARRLLAAYLLLSLVAVPVAARRGVVVPIRVRIGAYVGAAPEGVRPDATWRLRDRKREHRLDVVQLSVRSSGPSAGDIDAALSPYGYRLQLAGDKGSLERFRTLKMGQRVLIDGLLRLQGGAQYLLLDRVEITEPTPSP